MSTSTHAYPIIYATNEKYLPYLAVSIQSIIENTSPTDKFNIYILYSDLSLEALSKIERLNTENINIQAINISDYIEQTNAEQLKTCAHYSKEMYYRILIPTIFSQYNKVLYVDCDLVFNISPHVFFNFNIEQYCLGAINDIGVISPKSLFHDYIKSLQIEPTKYFNSGVLIMNIPKLNEINLLEQFNQIIKRKQAFKFPDQDILNIICKNKVLYLDYKYNFTCSEYQKNLPKQYYNNDFLFEQYMSNSLTPFIVHYTSSQKAWSHPHLKLAYHFWKYARKSPFYEEIIYINLTPKEIPPKKIKFSYLRYYEYKIKSKIHCKKQKKYAEIYKQLKKEKNQHKLL